MMIIEGGLNHNRKVTVAIDRNTISINNTKLFYRGHVIPMETFIYTNNILVTDYYRILHVNEKHLGYMYIEIRENEENIVHLPNATIYMDDNRILKKYVGRSNGLIIIRKGDFS
ncbi:hypothetical protein M2145_002918 [Lachnospiraceae bacterium PF1-21]